MDNIQMLRQILELGYPALITLACIKLFSEYRRMVDRALLYAEKCGCNDKLEKTD